MLANIPFAQYVKADFDFAKNFMIDPRNSFVFHIGVGVAYPYGNSKMLPFERGYFSGGANSVRGWSVRSLGLVFIKVVRMGEWTLSTSW